MIAEIVTLIHEDTAAIEPESPDGSGARGRMRDLLEQAGFERCEYFNLSAGIVALHRGFKL